MKARIGTATALGLAAMVAAITGPARPSAQVAAVAESPVRCSAYDDYLTPFAVGFEAGPDRGQYGARHALPALARYVRSGDRSLARGIVATLRHYGDWIDAQIAAQDGVQSFEGMTLLGIHRRELARRGALNDADERWFRETML